MDVKGDWKNYKFNYYDLFLMFGLVGLTPLLIVQCGYLASRKHLQFFPLAWLLFFAVVYLRGVPAGAVTKWRQRLGRFAFFGALSIATLAVLRFSPWLGQVAALVLLFAWMQVRLGDTRWTEIVSWCGLLLITIPLPMNGDTLLIQNLQALSTRSASHLLDLFGTPHLARGNVLEVRTGELFVDEACSGVDSLYSLAAIALILIVWQQKSFLTAVVTLALVPLWSWLGNLIRIFVIATMLDRFGIDWTHGWPHTVLGMTLFTASFACMMLAQSAISLVLTPFPVDTVTTNFVHRIYNNCVCWPRNTATSRKDMRLTVPKAAIVNPRRWHSAVAALFCTVFLVLGGVTALPIMGIGPWKSRLQLLPSWTSQQVSDLFIESDLPKDLSGFQLSQFGVTHRETGSVFGEHSATWTFQNAGQPIQVSLDFPFAGLHELEGCYVGGGKRVDSPVKVTEETFEAFKAQVYEVKLIDELNQTSFLWYLSCDADGVPLTKLRVAMWGGALATPPVAFQVQVFANDSGELTDTQRQVYKNALMQGCKTLLPKIKKLSEMSGN